MMKPWKFNTQAVHNEQQPDEMSGAVSQAIIPAVAYSFENAESAVEVVTGKKKEDIMVDMAIQLLEH